MPRFDVAVPGLGARRLDSHHDDVCARSRDGNSAPNILVEPLFLEDDMIGGEHADNGAGIDALQQKRCQPDRRRGIASHRLGQDLVRRKDGKLLQDRLAQIFVGDDPEALTCSERCEPLDRLLDHALRAVERQQLLGPAFAAERPEPRAPASGENDGIEIVDR